MHDAPNPYRAPQADAAALSPAPALSLEWPTLIAWPFVFGLNLIVPLIFAWDVTQEHGQWGMAVAVFAMLVSGWALGCFRPVWLRRVVMGGIFVAGTQFIPILQVVAGMVALLVVSGPISNEFMGCVVTLLVGGQLLAVAAGVGLVLSLLFRPGLAVQSEAR